LNSEAHSNRKEDKTIKRNRTADSAERFLISLKEQLNYSENTIQAYAVDIAQFNNFLSEYHSDTNIAVEKIDKSSIRHFLGKLVEEGISRKSIARKLAALRSWFKYLIRTGVIENNPAKNVSFPKIEKRLPLFLSSFCSSISLQMKFYFIIWFLLLDVPVYKPSLILPLQHEYRSG